jgi:hypothetical protein
LESIGAQVIGKRIADWELGVHPRIKVFNDSDSIEELRENIQEIQVSDDLVKGFKNPSLEGVTKLNLDITAFLAYVSNLTNGHSNVPFRKSILADQAADERDRAQKPILDKIFEGWFRFQIPIITNYNAFTQLIISLKLKRLCNQVENCIAVKLR